MTPRALEGWLLFKVVSSLFVCKNLVRDTHPTLGCPCRCCLCQVFHSNSSAVPQTAIDDRDDAIVGQKRLSEWKGLDEESLVVVEEEELMID
jgi:hypothetical protein